MQNPDEFWAEASQAWFGANARRDVNCGLRTRDEVRARVPGLADLLTRVYGAAASGSTCLIARTCGPTTL